MSPLPKYFDGIRLPRYVFFLSLGCLMLFSGVHVGLILLLYRLGCSDIVLVHLVLLYWVLVAVGLTKYIQWYTRRFYEKPIRRIAEAAGKVAGGDFSVYLPPVHTPDHLDCLDALTEDFNRMVEALGSIETLKTEFFSNVSHEIKTPIAAAHLMAADLHGGVAAKLKAELDRIESYVEQALYYARSTSLARDYAIRELPLAEAVRAACKKNARYLIEHGAIPSIEVGDDVSVFADASWLSFVLGQVVVNAAKYGATAVRFTAREEGTGTSAARTVLEIADNGRGIPAADVPRVFDRGFTGENGRDQGSATGMGLYLVATLCEKMGLGVGLASEEGTGTRVMLAFPHDRRRRDVG